MTGTLPMTLDGRYRLIAPIAAGGMSVVWRGHDDVLARPVAVKLLASVPTDGTFTEQVRREAMAIARISHPYIANVYDYGESPEPSGAVVPYIVMELVEGSSLAEILTRGPLSWPTAAGICAQVAAALSAAHQFGVVHRDVTPANIMLCVDGVKVVDFGISAMTGRADEQQTADRDAGQQLQGERSDSERVADEQVFGTPAYLAPERLCGGPALAATDVYGLGLVLYQMLAGRLPWSASTTTQMLTAHRYVAPAPLPAIAGMPSHLVSLCERSLAVEPGSRPSSAQLSVELSAIARAGDPRARPALSGASTAALDALGGTNLRGPTGTRVLPERHRPDSASPTVAMMAACGKAAVPTAPVPPPPVPPPPPPTPSTRRRERGMFVLPAVLLALLVGCLTWASLHQEAQTTTSPAPTPSVTVPHAIAAAPPKVHTAPSVSCRVDYEMLAQWVFGFTAEVTIVNTGTSAIAGWTLRFDLQPGQTVGGGWSGQWKQDGSAVTVSDATYNGAVPPGGSVMIGFVGNQSGNTPAAPTHFTLNGAACN